jgi:hypothetical protein
MALGRCAGGGGGAGSSRARLRVSIAGRQLIAGGERRIRQRRQQDHHSLCAAKQAYLRQREITRARRGLG